MYTLIKVSNYEQTHNLTPMRKPHGFIQSKTLKVIELMGKEIMFSIVNSAVLSLTFH